MEFMFIIIGFIVGCVITGIIFCIRHPVLGRIEVDEKNPEDVKWRFVLTKEVDFSKQKRILLKVDNHADLSQK